MIQTPPDTQHEHNGPTSCRAFSSLEDASPDNSFTRKTRRTCASRHNRGRAAHRIEPHRLNLMATRIQGINLRLTLCTYSPRAHKRKRNRHRTWTRHRRSRDCHLPTILRELDLKAPGCFSARFVEKKSSEGASACDIGNGINDL